VPHVQPIYPFVDTVCKNKDRQKGNVMSIGKHFAHQSIISTSSDTCKWLCWTSDQT